MCLAFWNSTQGSYGKVYLAKDLQGSARSRSEPSKGWLIDVLLVIYNAIINRLGYIISVRQKGPV